MNTMNKQQLVEEVKQWNTPIVGAFLLWRFTQGYCSKHPNGDAPVMLLHFLATAVLTNKKLLESINNRRKSLQAFIRGFEENNNSDLLVGLNQRVLSKRKYTLDCINIAISSGLLVLDFDSGKLYPRDVKKAKRGASLGHLIRRNGDKAEILGTWFSSHDLSTIAAYMEVVF